MRSSLILILFIPFAFSFEYDDDPEYKRYKAAYEYVVNSPELDSFCTFYEIPDSARTFCLSKMVKKYLIIDDSVVFNPYKNQYAVEYKDLSGINDNEIGCFFKLRLSEVSKDEMKVGLFYGVSHIHVHDESGVELYSNEGIDYIINFVPGSDHIWEVSAMSYIE